MVDARDIIERGQVEILAQLLHEAGRTAVKRGLVYRKEFPIKPFCEWVDLPEDVKEGRRSMARYLLSSSLVVDLLKLSL